jgi:hypothetical protein
VSTTAADLPRDDDGALELAVDRALVEGLIMHRMLSTAPSSREHTREAFARALAPAHPAAPSSKGTT